jgi:hypothetical protein
MELEQNSITVYTIGHGRHAWKDFLALLRRHEIAFLCVIFLKRFPFLES